MYPQVRLDAGITPVKKSWALVLSIQWPPPCRWGSPELNPRTLSEYQNLGYVTMSISIWLGHGLAIWSKITNTETTTSLSSRTAVIGVNQHYQNFEAELLSPVWHVPEAGVSRILDGRDTIYEQY